MLYVTRGLSVCFVKNTIPNQVETLQRASTKETVPAAGKPTTGYLIV